MLCDLEIRRADLADMSDVVSLCSKHAAHERVDYDPTCKREALTTAIFEPPSKLVCLVASLRNTLVGYTTCIPQYSTWSAAEYLYMDCLYVESSWRGLGIGKRLMHAVAEEAKTFGYSEIQWQTPDFNVEAVRFYDAVNGTSRLSKLRFTWQL
ncbi:MAG: GNAT family N-acetyltransferase [Planctomycetota bacterium]